MTDFVTTEEAAKAIGVTKRTLVRYMQEYSLHPEKKFGPSYIWTDEDINAVKEHRKQNTRVV